MADSPVIRTAVATLGKKGDVHIPVPLLERAGWPKEESPVSLVAQWVEDGRLRLHLETAIRGDLQARRARIASDQSEEMAAFLDMYRDVQLYFSKTQTEKYTVALKSETASHLAIPAEDREIYLEAREGVIDILSPTCRNRRLRDFRV